MTQTLSLPGTATIYAKARTHRARQTRGPWTTTACGKTFFRDTRPGWSMNVYLHTEGKTVDCAVCKLAEAAGK